MKFRFQGIDGTGSVLRGVMRADTGEHARELLRGEGVFEKKLEPAGEEEKVTWVPRQRILSRAQGTTAGADSPSRGEDVRPVRALFQTKALLGFDKPAEGRAGLTEDGTFVFEPSAREQPRLALPPEELETAHLAGFPARLLRLTLLSGRMYEFTAGFLIASGTARAIQKELAGRLKSTH